MPDTGPRAPDRTLVAVRAIVPVTQMPPNRAEAMLATPCATSSQFERWRRPVMLSATTAESRLSIAAQQRERQRRRQDAPRPSRPRSSGRCGAGSAVGMPPKRVPMVSTGRPSSPGRSPPPARPRSGRRASAGGSAARRGYRPIASDGDRDGGRVDAWAGRRASATSLGTIGPGSSPASVRPSSSLSWLARMMTAMPAVNPTVTG